MLDVDLAKQVSVPNLDKEILNKVQLAKLLVTARELCNKYVHNYHYVKNDLNKLYFDQANEDLFLVRQNLIKMTEHQHHPFQTNCLGITTYLSIELQKHKIPHNIVVFTTTTEYGGHSYHAVLLYKYLSLLLVCDITYSSTYPTNEDTLFLCPYDSYPKIYYLMTGESINLSTGIVYDPLIYRDAYPVYLMRLSDWSFEQFGLFSKDKLMKVNEDLRNIYYANKYGLSKVAVAKRRR